MSLHLRFYFYMLCLPNFTANLRPPPGKKKTQPEEKSCWAGCSRDISDPLAGIEFPFGIFQL